MYIDIFYLFIGQKALESCLNSTAPVIFCACHLKMLSQYATLGLQYLWRIFFQTPHRY